MSKIVLQIQLLPQSISSQLIYTLIKSLTHIIIYFRTMFKPIGFILVLALTLLALHPAKIIVKNLSPILINQLMRLTNLQMDRHPPQLSLQSLEELTSLPLIGKLFIQKKVKLLVNKRLWDNVLEQCKKNEKSILVQNTSLLPLRAVAECATYRFIKCQQTLKELQLIAPHLLKSISHLYEVFTKLRQDSIDQQIQIQSLKIAEI